MDEYPTEGDREAQRLRPWDIVLILAILVFIFFVR